MSDTLRSYLVALGFQVNEPSFRHFNQFLSSSENRVLQLGAATVETTAAITLMTARIAKQQNDLFYLSQRTGTSVAGIQSVGFAFGQIGLSAEQAKQSVDSFASAVRSNPGLAGLFRGLTGQNLSGDSRKDQRTLVGSIRSLPDFVALQYAGIFRMDEQVYIQQKNNYDRLLKQEKDAMERRESAGVADPEITKKFTNLNSEVNKLYDNFDILEQRLGADFVDPARAVVGFLNDMTEGFVGLNKETRQFIAILATLGGSSLAMWIIKRILGFGGGAAAAAPAAAGAAPAVAGGSAIGLVARSAMRSAGPLGILLASTDPANAGEADLEKMTPSERAAWEAAHRLNGGGRQTRGDRNNNPGNIEYGKFAISHGATGTDGRFAIFPTKEAGEAAMDKLLQGKSYAGLSVAQIQRRWVGNEDAGYVGSMRKATGLGANDVPNLTDPAVRHGLMAGMALGEGSHLSGGVTINQKTDIAVHGGADPAATGRAVASEQHDVNQRLVRSAAGVAQ